MRSSEKRYIMDLAKDIIIAKLSTSAPGSTTSSSGENIGSMYEAIYNKLEEIYFADNSSAQD